MPLSTVQAAFYTPRVSLSPPKVSPSPPKVPLSPPKVSSWACQFPLAASLLPLSAWWLPLSPWQVALSAWLFALAACRLALSASLFPFAAFAQRLSPPAPWQCLPNTARDRVKTPSVFCKSLEFVCKCLIKLTQLLSFGSFHTVSRSSEQRLAVGFFCWSSLASPASVAELGSVRPQTHHAPPTCALPPPRRNNILHFVATRKDDCQRVDLAGTPSRHPSGDCGRACGLSTIRLGTGGHGYR